MAGTMKEMKSRETSVGVSAEGRGGATGKGDDGIDLTIEAMTSWAQGAFRAKVGSTALPARFGDSGLVRCGERTRRTGQGNLGTQIWTPCDSPRHNTTASGGFKYE